MDPCPALINIVFVTFLTAVTKGLARATEGRVCLGPQVEGTVHHGGGGGGGGRCGSGSPRQLAVYPETGSRER